MSSRWIRKIDNFVTSTIGKTGRSILLVGSSALGVLVVFDYKFSDIVVSNGNAAGLERLHHLWWTRLAFGRTRSRLWGSIMNRKIPLSLRKPLYLLFTSLYNCNLDELRYPIESYCCLGHFFARTLDDTSRPIQDLSPHSMISPCDGEIVSFGDVTEDRVEQIKGSYFKIAPFLGIDPSEIKEKKLKYCIIYLAPGNYHHFHSPCEFKLKVRRHFSGELFPVSKGFVKLFNDVFSINERVVLSGNWSHGSIHFAAVAAYNVGNIRLSTEPFMRTNSLRTQLWYLGGDIDMRTYNEHKTRPIEVGEHIGEFRMGSTIVIAFEAPDQFSWDLETGTKVKVGQRLGGSEPPLKPDSPKYAFYLSEPFESS